ncbi:hypothetical protein ACFLRW_03585 [Acidobacteriota bacterium]
MIQINNGFGIKRILLSFSVVYLFLFVFFFVVPQVSAQDDPPKVKIILDTQEILHAKLQQTEMLQVYKDARGQKPATIGQGGDGTLITYNELIIPKGECTAAVISEARYAIDQHFTYAKLLLLGNFAVDLIPWSKGPKALAWSVKMLKNWANAKSPEDFAEKTGESVLSGMVGKLDDKLSGQGSINEGYNLAKKAYTETMVNLQKEMKKGLDADIAREGCNQTHIGVSFGLPNEPGGKMYLWVDVGGDCLCRKVEYEHDRFIELGQWQLRISIELIFKEKDNNTLELIPGNFSYHINILECPCPETDDTRTDPEDPQTDPTDEVVHEGLDLTPKPVACHEDCRAQFNQWQDAVKKLATGDGYLLSENLRSQRKKIEKIQSELEYYENRNPPDTFMIPIKKEELRKAKEEEAEMHVKLRRYEDDEREKKRIYDECCENNVGTKTSPPKKAPPQKKTPPKKAPPKKTYIRVKAPKAPSKPGVSYIPPHRLDPGPFLAVNYGSGKIDPVDPDAYAGEEEEFHDNHYLPGADIDRTNDVDPRSRFTPEIALLWLPISVGDSAGSSAQFGPRIGAGGQSWDAQYDTTATPLMSGSSRSLNSIALFQQQSWSHHHSLLFDVSNFNVFLDGFARIRPNFLLSLPIDLFFDVYAGVNLAFGKLRHFYKFERLESSYTYTKDQNVTDTSLGSRFGLGCSILLNKYLTLGIQFSGGSTKFDSWTGERTDKTQINSSTSTSSYEGQLWKYKGVDNYDRVFPGLAVLGTKPEGEFFEVHPVTVKFNRFGIRINLTLNIKQLFGKDFR